MDFVEIQNLIQHNRECTGCRACYNVCNHDAIKIIFDENGFLKPVVDEKKCIRCGICCRTCPIYNPVYDNNDSPECYAIWAEEKIRKESTSGGAFTLLASEILREGGTVFGAGWSKDLRVVIKGVDKSEDLPKLRHSKYVQSDTEDSFRKVKEKLDGGRQILYSGCPCQIAGLKNYLGKNYDNLIAIDIMCNCVPSIKMLHKYLDEFCEKSDVTNIIFRDGSEKNPHHHRIIFSNGESVLKSKWKGDPYQAAYHYPNLMANEVCKNCRFSRFPRQGDITIGDFWGIEKIDPTWNDEGGTSLLMVNSEKGKALFSKVQKTAFRVEKIPIEKVKSLPNRFSSPGHFGPDKQRELFVNKLKTKTFSKSVKIALGQHYDIGVAFASTLNYGGNLTNFALYRYLEKEGNSVLLIDRCQDSPDPPRNKPFLMFEQSPIPEANIVAYKDKKSLCSANKRCEIFMLGSDQMLHPNFIRNYNHHTCLDWVHSYKTKIAYASSFGRERFDGTEKFKNEIGGLLRRFDCFSVREESAISLSKSEFNISAELVLDPVFLCETEDYLQIAKNGKVSYPENGYVGAYILDPTQRKSELLDKICADLCLPYMLIRDVYTPDNKYSALGLKFIPEAKVEDWINLIFNCKFLVTDSYHGACFAMIFNKPFVLIKNPMRGSTRMDSLVNQFGIERHVINEGEKTEVKFDVNYKKLKSKMKREISNSKNWLNKALKMKSKNLFLEKLESRWEGFINQDTDKKMNDITKFLKEFPSIIDENLIDELSYCEKAGNHNINYFLGVLFTNSKFEGFDSTIAARNVRAAINYNPLWTMDLINRMINTKDSEMVEEAISIVEEFSKMGEPRAMMCKSKMYRDGIGFDKDMVEAKRWMRKASEKHGWAKIELIDMLADGTEEERKEAAKICVEFAKKGDKYAIFRMGRLYRDGVGVGKSEELAKSFMRKAASLGVEDAKEELADMLIQSSKNDIKEAKELLLPSANLGIHGAQLRIAYMYRDGIGFDKDMVEAKRWMRKASEKHGWAKIELIDMLAEGTEEERKEAIAICRAMAKNGDSKAKQWMMRFEKND